MKVFLVVILLVISQLAAFSQQGSSPNYQKSPYQLFKSKYGGYRIDRIGVHLSVERAYKPYFKMGLYRSSQVDDAGWGLALFASYHLAYIWSPAREVKGLQLGGYVGVSFLGIGAAIKHTEEPLGRQWFFTPTIGLGSKHDVYVSYAIDLALDKREDSFSIHSLNLSVNLPVLTRKDK